MAGEQESGMRAIVASRAIECGMYDSDATAFSVLESEPFRPFLAALAVGRCIVAVQTMMGPHLTMRTVEWTALPPGVEPFRLPDAGPKA